jgi:hypothetical protein
MAVSKLYLNLQFYEPDKVLLKAENHCLQILHAGPWNSMTPVVMHNLKGFGFRTQAVSIRTVSSCIKSRTVLKTSRCFETVVGDFEAINESDESVFNWAADILDWQAASLVRQCANAVAYCRSLGVPCELQDHMQKQITAGISERVSLPPSLILARKIAWICPYSARESVVVLVGNLHKALAILPSFIFIDCLKCLLNAWCVARRFGRKKPCPCCLAFSPPTVRESDEHLSVCRELLQLRCSLPLRPTQVSLDRSPPLGTWCRASAIDFVHVSLVRAALGAVRTSVTKSNFLNAYLTNKKELCFKSLAVKHLLCASS